MKLAMCDPHFVFKPAKLRYIMVSIVGQMFDERTRWRDEFNFGGRGRSPRSVATVFAMLQRIGLLKRLKQRRRSQIEHWKGRMVWKYKLTSGSRGFCFTNANAYAIHFTYSHDSGNELTAELAAATPSSAPDQTAELLHPVGKHEEEDDDL
jgi:hypothetical protein